MKTWIRIAGIAALSAAVTLTAGAESVAITATRKTVSQSKGSEQDLPRGKSRATEKSVLYRFELQRMSPQVAEDVSVEWMVLIETADGRVAPATMGQAGVKLALGQRVPVETGTVKLLGREWRGGPVPGTVEDEIEGYGVRVLGPDGAVLAEKYDPAATRDRIDWKLLQAPSRQQLPWTRRSQGMNAPGAQPPERLPPP